jgi:alkanesulfonate monooxygenase SsuD/methylene tetrahydromethanopterin reductase-like flavin-dependent oxidoreductase (luciferase family)
MAEDFAMRPEGFADRKDVMMRTIDAVRRLWRGEVLPFPGPLGKPVELRTLPRPIRSELPVWIPNLPAPPDGAARRNGLSSEVAPV